MPRFSLTKNNGRTKSSHNINYWPEAQHPDLPLSPQPPPQAPTPRPQNTLNRSSTVSDRFSYGYAGDRRSIAIGEQGLGVFGAEQSEGTSNDFPLPSPQISGTGLSRSQTVVQRREASNTSRTASSPYQEQQGSPSPVWSPDFSQLPTPDEQHELYSDDALMSSSQHTAPGKTSSDSGQQSATDRFTQRRLQRLNTEQGFREQRQGGGQTVLSPPPTGDGSYNSVGGSYSSQDTQPQPPLHQQPQPHPAQQAAYQTSRTAQSHPNAALVAQTPPVSNSSRSPNYQYPDQSQQQYSPPDSGPQYPSQENSRPQVTQSRSFGQQQAGAEDNSMSSSNNGNLPAPKAQRSSNRQSVHNGLNTRDASGSGSAQQQGVAAFNASVVPTTGQSQAYKGNQGQQQADVGRITPQPVQLGEDMSEEDINQLIKDHKELRDKYTKVKKYYFEKEDQVKQLQNSLAHQRLSQSRTSLDDSEYTTRFNRLDGLIAQLAFSIRKSWKITPHWLDKSVNKDAVTTGKQEMTAAGRAVISHWLVDEAFNKYFHPDLEPGLSQALKTVQINIRRFAPPAQTVEEEEFLTSKVVNWRLSTLEGLQEHLRSPQCPTHRAQLTDTLKAALITHLASHLQEPPPSDLEGGVHMIIELVVSIAIHLPVESRDVVIEYFMPGYSILQDQMKLESGIPPLAMSVADDNAERASMKSAQSDITDMTENSNAALGDQPKKRSMLSALTGTGKMKSAPPAQGKHAAAGGSSSSLNRPESTSGVKDEPPRVRMAAGIGVQIRGRSVLVKAPVFGT